MVVDENSVLPISKRRHGEKGIYLVSRIGCFANAHLVEKIERWPVMRISKSQCLSGPYVACRKIICIEKYSVSCDVLRSETDNVPANFDISAYQDYFVACVDFLKDPEAREPTSGEKPIDGVPCFGIVAFQLSPCSIFKCKVPDQSSIVFIGKEIRN